MINKSLPTSNVTNRHFRQDRLFRQETLAQLRWVAIFGQLIALGVAYWVYKLQLNYFVTLGVLAIWALANLVQGAVFRFRSRLSHDWSLLALSVDLVEMTILLYFTGGINNPFAIFLIVPAAFAATTLDRYSLVLLVLMTIAAALLLYFNAAPLYLSGVALVMPPLLEQAFVIALIILTLFLSFFSWRISYENAKMTNALTASELALQREHKLSALGGLVAAYAHELGTPLATLRLTVGDLLENSPKKYQEDLQLMKGEIARCSDILAGMGRLGKDDMMIQKLPFLALVREAAEPHFNRGKAIEILVNGEEAEQEWTPYVERAAATIHGLRNLIQNAVDFAKEMISIDIAFNDETLSVRIIDDGEGYPADVLGRLGEPYLRSRRVKERQGYEGMGIGTFIAKNLLEATGAKLSFANMPRESGKGAVVNLRWHLDDIEIDEREVRRALGENPEQLF